MFVQNAPSKFETGKNLFWLAVAIGLLALFISNWPPSTFLQEITSSGSDGTRGISDSDAVNRLRADVVSQFKTIATELSDIRQSLKSSDDKGSKMAKVLQELSIASDEMGKWIKAAGAESDKSTGAGQESLKALQLQATSLAAQIAELGSVEARQNATFEAALSALESKLVALQDERDAKLRAEIKRVEQHFLTVAASADGKQVTAIEPDESKIREIAVAVLKDLSKKHWDEVSATALASISEENLKKLVRESISSDSAVLKALYDNHVKSQVSQDATKTAAEVASHLIAEAVEQLARTPDPNVSSGDKENRTETPTAHTPTQAPAYVSIDKDEIVRLVGEQLEKQLIGGVAMPDYALKKAGAAIVPSLTQSRHFPVSSDAGAFKKLIANLLPPAPRSGPEEALKPVVSASDCWPFYGGSANMTVELACAIKPTYITVDHIHPSLTPHPESAPKSFKVWALSSTNGAATQHRHLLGAYTFDNKAKNIQSFPVQHPVQTWTPYVTLEITDNWGHWYTCLYRFRVHGEPSDSCKSKI